MPTVLRVKITNPQTNPKRIVICRSPLTIKASIAPSEPAEPKEVTLKLFTEIETTWKLLAIQTIHTISHQETSLIGTTM
jgi:hypothetical protein